MKSPPSTAVTICPGNLLLFAWRLLLVSLVLARFIPAARAATNCAEFFTDFKTSLPNNTHLFGKAFVDSSGGIDNTAVLKLTVNANDQIGSFVVDDFFGGRPVNRFVAAFKVRIGGGTTPPADGFSFCFANDLPDAAFGEEGAGSGLTVAFDNFDNGGGEAPAIDIKWGTGTIAHTAVATVSTGESYVDVVIQLYNDGSVDVSYAGATIYTRKPTPYVPISGGRFALGARTGGLNANHWVDDLHLTVCQQEAPLIIGCPSDVITSCSAGVPRCPTNLAQFLAFGGVASGCDSNLTYTCHDESSVPAPGGQLIRRLHSVRDGCSNEITCAQLITLIDEDPPVLFCPPDMTVRSLSSVPPRPTTWAEFVAAGGSAYDNCSSNLVYVSSDDPLIDDGCGGGRIFRIHTVSDTVSNRATCVQQIIITGTRTLRWPGSATNSTGVSVPAMVGSPDGRTYSLNGENSVTLGSFTGAYSDGGLAGLLGVNEDFLARANVIAFEYNGGQAPCSQWESCRWTFSDGRHPNVTVDLRDRDRVTDGCPEQGLPILRSGSFRTEDNPRYTNFFGFGQTFPNQVVSWVLFQVPILDTSSPEFTIRVTDGKSLSLGGEGTPDPDAVGVFVNGICPSCTITCASNRTVECNTTWDFVPPTVACGTNPVIEIVSTTTNGSSYTRTWSVRDCCGSSAQSQCSQTITVIDTQPPVITCPRQLSYLTSSGDVVVDYGRDSQSFGASDNCSVVTPICQPPSGSRFPIGTNFVECRAIDAGSNYATCRFPVIVMRSVTNCLVWSCPSDILVQCEGVGGTYVKYDPPKGTNVCSHELLTWTCWPPPGVFPPGTNVVVCRGPVFDDGTLVDCQFRITVNGQCPTPPPCLYFACPSNMVVQCASANGTLVQYSFTASNHCSSDLIASCVPPSGSVFAPGTNVVVCTVIGAGQTNECRFNVAVVGDCSPQVGFHLDLTGLTFSWPKLNEGYVLQCSTVLGGDESDWAEVQGTIKSNGDTYQMTVPTSVGVSRFYRLSKALRPREPFPKPAQTGVDPDRSLPQRVVLKFHEGTHVRLRGGLLCAEPMLSGAEKVRLRRVGLTIEQVARDVAAINERLGASPGIAVSRMFNELTESANARQKDLGEANVGEELADMALYYDITRPDVDPLNAAALINALNGFASVEIAYAQPISVAPSHDVPPRTEIDLGVTQNYLDPAPMGINARYAWTYPGGRGDGGRIVDIESGWVLDHEDLPHRHFLAPPFTGGDTDHGTAVLGILVAAENEFGVTGIVPNADYGVAYGISIPVVSVFAPVPLAILSAAALLERGDVILLEVHARGPASGLSCPCNCGQFEFVPQEFFPADRDAIQFATALGIIVVEAAGNGSMNLDSTIYGNPSRLARRNRTRAILVGASNGGGNNQTACFSNFGSGVDVHGWGGMVATLGYGDPGLRANGDDRRQWYTANFSGTSSASPIVAGAVLAIQGGRRARGLPPLTPVEMRQLLSTTGTAQPPDESRPVGPLPNLRSAFGTFLPQNAEFVRQTVPAAIPACGHATVSITLRNIGTTTWRQTDLAGQRYALSSQNPLNNTLWTGADRVPLPVASVVPGESVTFDFVVTAPCTSGTYTFQWRMVQDSVEWFGDMTPSVSVTVGVPTGFTRIPDSDVVTRLAGPPVVGQNGDGRIEVFAHGLQNQILHLAQRADDRNQYTGWEPLTPTSLFISGGPLAVARNADNRLEVFGWLLTGHYAHLWQTTPGTLSRSAWSGVNGWERLVDPHFVSDPAVGVNFDGRLEVFGTAEAGDLSHDWQVFPNGDFWVWSGLEGTPTGTPAVVRANDGRLHVFARWTDTSIRHISQTSAGGGWTSWASLGGSGVIGDPAAGVRPDGQIEVLVRGGDNGLWNQVQSSDGSFPGAWLPLGNSLRARPSVARNADGRLEVFVVTAAMGAVDHVAQSAPNGPWGAWETLGGSGIREAVAVGLNSDGRLEIFVRGGDDGLWHQKQFAPGVWR